MDSTQSEDVLEMESPVNNSSERCFQTNQIWHELFPEPKTMLMSELEDLIDKIGEVSILESLYIAAKYKDSRILRRGYKKDFHFALILGSLIIFYLLNKV